MPTDVLSFPFNNTYPEIIKPDVENSANSSDRKLPPRHTIEKRIDSPNTTTNIPFQDSESEIVKDLGDIVLSVEYAINDCKQNNENILDWTRILLVHSFCHLLGYDHEKEQDYLKIADRIATEMPPKKSAAGRRRVSSKPQPNQPLPPVSQSSSASSAFDRVEKANSSHNAINPDVAEAIERDNNIRSWAQTLPKTQKLSSKPIPSLK
ncbi:Endoribonuclease YbeY, partial [Smittium culicis]